MDIRQAQLVAPQIKVMMVAIKVVQLPVISGSLPLSIGILVLGPDDDLSRQREKADQAMCQAKKMVVAG